MCHVSTGKQVSGMETRCDCGCDCPVMLSIEDEIRLLEDHKKIMQDRIETIDKKIAGLKTVNEP
jgi:hypothetical protein